MKDMVGNKFMKLKNELHIGKNDIIAMGLMLLALLILMQYRTYRPFLDESDNFLGGKILSRGGEQCMSFRNTKHRQIHKYKSWNYPQ